MSKNYEIKTVSKFISGASSHITIGSSVAAGMKRYVTFLALTPAVAGGTTGTRIFFCSTAASNTAANTAAASVAQKIVMSQGSATGAATISVPSTPDTEHPLFTIAASKWCTAYLCSVAGFRGAAHIFAQYYDE